MAKLVDALDLGSSAVRLGGSSPFTRTKSIHMTNLDTQELYLRKASLDAEITRLKTAKRATSKSKRRSVLRSEASLNDGLKEAYRELDFVVQALRKKSRIR